MKKQLISLALALALLIALTPAVTQRTQAAEAIILELVNHISTDLYINKVVASPDSKLLLIHDYYRDMYLFNISTGICIQILDNTVAIDKEAMRFSPDGSLCAVKTASSWDGYSNTIDVFDTKSGEHISSLHIVGSAAPLAFNLDNNLIVNRLNGDGSHNYKEGIAVVDARSGATLLEMDGRSSMIRQNPVSDHIVLVTSNGVRVYNGKTGGSIRTVEMGAAIRSMEFSPDGRYLAVATADKTLLYDAENNYSKVCDIGGSGRLSFINDSDMLAIGNCVYFASDGFVSFTELGDSVLTPNEDCGFVTQDGKYFINFDYNSRGVRLMDASKISVRLNEIRLQPEAIELSLGEELELKLTGIYSDGTSRELTWGDATASISDFSIARMNGNGKILGLTTGETILKITCQGKALAVAVTVVPRRPIETAAIWARDGINSAVAKGFVPTDLQDNYANVITRQEFCRLAVKFVEYGTGKSIDTVLAERGVARTPDAFSDTADPDILAAFALGITNGTGDGKFTPNGMFSREQAATMLMNACKVMGMSTQGVPAAGFGDMGSAASWATEGINFCYANGIMGGTSTTTLTFSPKGTYTRQESIITFNRIQ